MATEKTTLYKMGKKYGFLIIIIGKTRYRVKIGNDTWAFVDTDEPGPYYETVIMPVSTTVTITQHSQLYSYHISKLNNYEQLLGANSAVRDLITGAIDSHIITYIFDDVIGYEEHYPSKITTFL